MYPVGAMALIARCTHSPCAMMSRALLQHLNTLPAWPLQRRVDLDGRQIAFGLREYLAAWLNSDKVVLRAGFGEDLSGRIGADALHGLCQEQAYDILDVLALLIDGDLAVGPGAARVLQ